MSKPGEKRWREFRILDSGITFDNKTRVSMSIELNEYQTYDGDPTVSVIEREAFTALLADFNRLKEGLKFYAEGYIDHQETVGAITASKEKMLSQIRFPRVYGDVARGTLQSVKGKWDDEN